MKLEHEVILERIEKHVAKIANAVGAAGRSRSAGGGSGGALTAARGGVGGGGGGGGILAARAGAQATGGLGGLAGAAGSLIKRTGMGMALAGAAGGAALAGQGLVSRSQGGTFTGGVGRAGLSAAASVPILGEMSGAASADRVVGSVEDKMNAVTNQIARYGGKDAVTPEIREFLGNELGRQERDVEADRKANKAYVNSNMSDIAGNQAGASGSVLQVLERIAAAVESDRFAATGGG